MTGARVRVREIHLRAVADVRRAAATVVTAARRVPADVRHLRSRRDARSTRRETRRAPRRPAPRRCRRTATACRGRCRGAARPIESRARIAARHCSSRRRVASKCPTPGTMMPRAAARSSGVSASDDSAAKRRERLADRREIAGAVVDQRDHSSPFVLGSIFASRRSFAQATRSARANALKHASIL